MPQFRNYSPGGFTHRILKRLGEGPATVHQIRERLGFGDEISATQAKRVRQHIALLVSDGCVMRQTDTLALLGPGEELLEDLNARMPGGTGRPSVRIFERRAA